MTIHGGTVSIFDTTITHNTSQGNGGGILLVGASAQIAHSFIQNNETNTTQAGGIAVEANTENSYTSFLVLTDNTVVQPNSNVNAQSSPLFAVNIDGQIVGQDAATMSIKSGPPKSPGATSSPQFLGNLKSEDFQKYCQKPPFTKTTVSSDAQTITCASDDGEKLVLSSQNRQVELVCAMLHPNAKFILARLFRYGDGTSWQCFQDEHFLSSIMTVIPSTKQAPIDRYCASASKDDASATLMAQPNQPKTAYDWSCKQNTHYLPIPMDLACQYVTENSFAIAKLVNYSDPYSWECWGPRDAGS